MSSITLACPHCRQALAIDAALSGRAVSCPTCRRRFQVPPTAAPVQQTSKRGSAPRYRSKRPKRTAFWTVLGLAVVIVSLAGAGMICHERGMLSFDFGDSEASARSALSAELDKWMARQKHDATHFEFPMRFRTNVTKPVGAPISWH